MDSWSSLALAAVRFEQSLERLTSTLESAGRDLERARSEHRSFLIAAKQAEAGFVATASLAPLTSTERKVAILAAAGRTDAEVAAVVHLSVHTVKTHMKSILRKLGLRSRWQLVYELGSPSSLPAEG